MSIRFTQFLNGLVLSTTLSFGASTMEGEEATGTPPPAPAPATTEVVAVQPSDATTTTDIVVSIPAEPTPAATTGITAEEVEARVQRCCFLFGRGLETANSILTQSAVTTLLLSENIVLYDELLGQGMNRDNILQFQERLKTLLKVGELNKNTIAMIQKVIDVHPRKTLRGKNETQPGTQMAVSRSLLRDNRVAYNELLDHGMTAKNFTNQAYRKDILGLAGIKDTSANRKMIKRVLKVVPEAGIALAPASDTGQ